MDMDFDDNNLLATTIKEERIDFDEDEKKFEPKPRGRTRSLSKKKDEKVDIKAKLERSRQSARECRARKKLRYQYLEEVISETEKAILALRRELDTLKIWSKEMDEGRLPENLVQYRTSCVEKKLANPYKLQPHHHAQIQRQRAAQEAQDQAAAAMGGGAVGGVGIAIQQSPNSLGSGGICISPSTSFTHPMRSSGGGHSLHASSPSAQAQLSPYMQSKYGSISPS